MTVAAFTVLRQGWLADEHHTTDRPNRGRRRQGGGHPLHEGLLLLVPRLDRCVVTATSPAVLHEAQHREGLPRRQRLGAPVAERESRLPRCLDERVGFDEVEQ